MIQINEQNHNHILWIKLLRPYVFLFTASIIVMDPLESYYSTYSLLNVWVRWSFPKENSIQSFALSLVQSLQISLSSARFAQVLISRALYCVLGAYLSSVFCNRTCTIVVKVHSCSWIQGVPTFEEDPLLVRWFHDGCDVLLKLISFIPIDTI